MLPGSVLGHLLFHIVNDITERLLGKICLFADDTKMYILGIFITWKMIWHD